MTWCDSGCLSRESDSKPELRRAQPLCGVLSLVCSRECDSQVYPSPRASAAGHVHVLWPARQRFILQQFCRPGIQNHCLRGLFPEQNLPRPLQLPQPGIPGAPGLVDTSSPACHAVSPCVHVALLGILFQDDLTPQATKTGPESSITGLGQVSGIVCYMPVLAGQEL